MEHLLLIAIVLSVPVSLWAVAAAGRNGQLSISLHVAQSKQMQLVFGIALLVATVLMTGGLFGWLLPRYEAGVLTYVTFGAIIGCLALIALVPHVVDTWREPVHTSAAWGLVYAIPVAMLLMLTWPLSMAAWSVGVALTVVIVILLILGLTRKSLRRWMLYFQSAYLGIFFGFLLVAAYL